MNPDGENQNRPLSKGGFLSHCQSSGIALDISKSWLRLRKFPTLVNDEVTCSERGSLTVWCPLVVLKRFVLALLLLMYLNEDLCSNKIEFYAMTFISNVIPEENPKRSGWNTSPASVAKPTVSNYFYMDNIFVNPITSQSNQFVLFTLLKIPVWNRFLRLHNYSLIVRMNGWMGVHYKECPPK